MRGNRAHRTDDNHAEVVAAFIALGCSVADTHALGKGFPDIVVGLAGRNYLVEIKNEGGELTDPERGFMAAWEGQAEIVYDVDQVVALINRWRTGRHGGTR